MLRIFKWMVICSFLFAMLLVGAGYFFFTAEPELNANSVLKIEFTSGLTAEGEMDWVKALSGEAPMTLRSLTESIRQAGSTPEINGILLDIRTTDIGIADIQEIEQAMAEFRAQPNKWSVAFLETAGEFSPGTTAYTLATCADEIFLTPPGELNVVGLRADVPFVRGLLDKWNIEPHVEQRHEYKNAGATISERKMTAPHREAIKALLDDLHQDVVTHVAKRREMTPKDVETWIATGPHDANRALELGMVDTLGYWDQARDRIKKHAGGDIEFVSLSDLPTVPSFAQPGTPLAVITGAGQIVRGASSEDPFNGDKVMGSDTITRAFRQARKAEVKGVLFRVDSPGGSYIASDLIRREVELTREAGIPVVVSMGRVAASGGYFVSIPANHIVAQPATITGSIGVIAIWFSTRRFFEEHLKINFDHYQTSGSAEVFSGLDPISGQKKEHLVRSLDRIYDDFTGKVAKARDLSAEEAHAVAKGRVWTGRAAKERGLVDELGGYTTALTKLKSLAGVAAGDDVKLIEFPEAESPIEVFRHLLSQGSAWARPLQTAMRLLKPLTQDTPNTVLLAPDLPDPR